MTPVPTYPVAWPRFDLARPTGAVELAVSEAAFDAAPRPQRVTALLSAVLGGIDGKEVSEALVWSLSCGSREWLVQQVAATCRSQPDWFDCACPACGAVFDVSLDLAEMPRAGVPEGFPEVTLKVRGEEVTARVPNGADEAAILAATGDPRRVLLSRCLSAPKALEGASEDEVIALEDALDQHCPDCADTMTTSCPDCAAAISARVDPLSYAFPRETAVLSDVHLLGRSYQWREADILALPTHRRKAYVGMITAQRPGLHP